MKVLVVGGGGREHALCWKIARSELVEEVICAPGNGGIADHARCVPVKASDIEGQIKLAKEEKVGLVVVGPEAPLTDGMVDKLEKEGILAFGPSAKAAMLEGSKDFSKCVMQKHGVPTALFSTHSDLDSAIKEVEKRNGPCVVKADGLAAGKGVIVCETADEAKKAVTEMLGDNRFGDAGSRVVIEDRLVGEEASVLAICDGKRVLPLVAAQDHKAIFEGDKGPNTGGMGAYAPAPVVTPERMEQIVNGVLKKTVDGMAKDGVPFKGILYAGLMIDGDDIKVLEFNVRFGDPECQPLLALMKSDIVPLLMMAAKGDLGDSTIEWNKGATLCVVLASDGYPGSYDTGKEITGLDKAKNIENLTVFHAGTKREDSKILTSGGRVLGVTGLGATLKEAAKVAYKGVDTINFENMRLRRDIGYRAL